MGLDIYFHKVKNASEEKNGCEWSEVSEIADKEGTVEFENAYTKVIKKLSKTTPEKYQEEAKKCLKTLAKFMNYPEYHINKLGYRTEWNGKTWEMILEPADLETFISLKDFIVKAYYAKYDAYFRKVNFVYAFFQNKLVDEVAWVTKDDVEELIARCEKVLADKGNVELAEELLPTQAGFFFGSTDYDGWYYHDVKDCLKQMKKLVKVFDKGFNVYVVMSW